MQLTFFAFPRASAATVTSDEVFSTYLYTGNGSTQTITNGIDLSGQGGLVWIKIRETNGGEEDHRLYDTERGAGNSIVTHRTVATQTQGNSLGAFNSDGFYLNGLYLGTNGNGYDYASWTFREAANFFDVVTYTGDGTSNKNVSHSLGVAPGMIVIKRTDSTSDWYVYHRGWGFPAEGGRLNGTETFSSTYKALESTDPTSSTFNPAQSNANVNGATYVAYLFAHDTSADGIIQCGSTSGSRVTLGWEPQWIIHKSTNFSTDWSILDTTRGMPWGQQAQELEANTSDAEALSRDDPGVQDYSPKIYADGFALGTIAGTHIYCAIRRPNKAPTVGTQVYNAGTYSGTNGNHDETVGFPSDMQWVKERQGEYSLLFDRLRGPSVGLMMDGTYADFTETLFGKSVGTFPNLLEASSPMTSVRIKGTDTAWNSNSSTYLHYNFRRYPGVFDVVAYTGTGVAHTEAHNLGVVPELIILKGRSTTYNWVVFSGYLPLTGAATSAWYDVSQGSSYVQLNTTGANGNGTGLTGIPTVTGVPLSTHAGINEASATQVMYLFATKPGISKVGSYTGNGSSQTINAGLSASAKFILIKRTDSTGDWYVWDSTRGIAAGNDPHLSLNTTAAEVTTDDSIDTDAAGFVVNQDAATNINVNAATYIYLALSDGAALSDSDSGTTFMLTFEAWMKKVTGLGGGEPPTLGGMMLLLLFAAYLSGKLANHARRLRFGKGSHPLGHSLKY